MATVAEVIHQHHAEILSLWKVKAERAASARGLSGPAFNNIMPVYLMTLADQPDARAEQAKHIESHLSTRMRQGFDLAEIHEELLILGHSIAAFWAPLPQAEQPSPADVERLHSNLQVAALDVTRLFQEHMQSDEQNEKRYLRVLQRSSPSIWRTPGSTPTCANESPSSTPNAVCVSGSCPSSRTTSAGRSRRPG